MKATFLASILTFAAICFAPAFDVVEASTERFKVSYVEPKKLPLLSEIPKQIHGRERALRNEKQAIEAGMSEKEIDQIRRVFLRDLHTPIRVTDTKTGNVYEVQSDRRTIIAKNKAGKVLWKINPFEDAKLKPYRVKYPFIGYFGKSTSAVKAGRGDRFLSVTFNSSQSGEINLEDGSFKLTGQD